MHNREQRICSLPKYHTTVDTDPITVRYLVLFYVNILYFTVYIVIVLGVHCLDSRDWASIQGNLSCPVVLSTQKGKANEG